MPSIARNDMGAHVDRAVQFFSYVAVVAIVVMSLVPGSSRPHTGAPGQGEHVVAYFLTALLFGLRGKTRADLLKVALAFVVGAGILEAAQVFVPGRNSQVGDFAASSIGALVGLVAGRALAPVYFRVLALLPK